MGLPPLDFFPGQFISRPLLILNQVDRCTAQHWRSTGGRDCPNPLFGLPQSPLTFTLNHNRTSHGEEEGVL